VHEVVVRNYRFDLPRLARICILSIAAIFVLTATALPDESISVVCYRNNEQIGSVVVFDPAAAAGACNTQYHDCRGRCTGCFYDFDYFRDVCVDIYGNTFLR
jgi:hypothetical protein